MKTTMNFFGSLFILLAVSLSAQAKYIPGSECGLIDSADDFELQSEKTQNLTARSPLTNLQKKQLIVAANSDNDLTGVEALHWLIEGSEAGEVYYKTGKFNGQSYEMVLSYPGGNPGATLFKKGQITPFAFIQDSDLVCLEAK